MTSRRGRRLDLLAGRRLLAPRRPEGLVAGRARSRHRSPRAQLRGCRPHGASTSPSPAPDVSSDWISSIPSRLRAEPSTVSRRSSLLALEPAGHVVERRAHLASSHPSNFGQTDRQVALAELLDAAAPTCAERPEHAAANRPDRQDDAEQQRDRRDDQRGPGALRELRPERPLVQAHLDGAEHVAGSPRGNRRTPAASGPARTRRACSSPERRDELVGIHRGKQRVRARLRRQPAARAEETHGVPLRL